jgi:hypothetical protein
MTPFERRDLKYIIATAILVVVVIAACNLFFR